MSAQSMKFLAPILLSGLLAGCATPSMVTLLPGETGSPVGAVAVFDAKSQAEVGMLDKENTEAALGAAKVTPKPAKADKYAALTAMMPAPPAHYTVYFLEGSTQLAPGSEPVLNQMFADLSRRPGAEVQIIGHTDTVGSAADNDALSLKRAKEVREALVVAGHLSNEVTGVSGRGERELLVATPDNTAEPKNRRVEIVVR